MLMAGLLAGVGSLFVGSKVFASSEWSSDISSAFTSSTSDLMDLVLTLLPIILGVLVAFFAISWITRKIFGKRK